MADATILRGARALRKRGDVDFTRDDGDGIPIDEKRKRKRARGPAPPAAAKPISEADALAILRQNIEDHEISNINRVAKTGKNQFPRAEFLKKFAALADDGPALIALAQSSTRVYFYDGRVLFLLCPICDTFREAITDNFAANNVQGKPAEWFAKMPHQFRLGKTGCNECWAQQSSVKVSAGDDYLKHLGLKYPSIYKEYTFAEKEAIKARYRAEKGHELNKVPKNDSGLAHLRAHVGERCPVSGVIMNDVKGDPYCVSVDSLNLQEGTYDQRKNHNKDDIRIVAAFVNVQQRSTKILNLSKAFCHMFTDSIRAVLGEDMEEEAAAIASIGPPYPLVLRNIRSNGFQRDAFYVGLKDGNRVNVPRAAPRRNDLETADKVAAILRAKHMRCATSGVVVRLQSGWNKAHLDRIDDTDGHNTANVDLKCALFMGRTKVSRKQYLEMIMSQKTVHVPAAARELFEAELARLQ